MELLLKSQAMPPIIEAVADEFRPQLDTKANG